MIAVLATVVWVTAGELNPPEGAIESTMKTLDEVRPGTPISELPFTIEESGFYHLTGNLTDTGGADGIVINASHVTLDLGGFSLIGSGFGQSSGIGTESSPDNVAIRNGTLRGWGHDGIDLQFISYTKVNNVSAFDNGNAGMELGNSAVVTNCVAARNDFEGIVTLNHALISGCSASENGNIGISTQSWSRLLDSLAVDNGSDGIAVSDSTLITDCNTSINSGNGISVDANSYVLHNVRVGNSGSFQAGIATLYTGNRLEANVVNGNFYGSDAHLDGDNLITNNVASGNQDEAYYLEEGNTTVLDSPGAHVTFE